MRLVLQASTDEVIGLCVGEDHVIGGFNEDFIDFGQVYVDAVPSHLVGHLEIISGYSVGDVGGGADALHPLSLIHI